MIEILPIINLLCNLRLISQSSNKVNNINRKVMFLYNIYSNVFYVFDNALKISKELNIHQSKVLDVINGKLNYTNEYVGGIYENDIELNTIDEITSEDEINKYIIPKLKFFNESEATSIKSIQPKLGTMNNKNYIFRNTAEFSAKYSISPQSIRRSLRENSKTKEGFTFRYLSFEYKCPKNDIIEY